jgi:amino acid transporter
MEETIQSALPPITIAALAGIFIIVLVCSQRALKAMPFFCDGPTWLLAFGVAVLSVIGIVQYFGSPERSAPAPEESKKPGGLLDFVLLPYVVLALGILFVLLLAAIERLNHRRQARRLSKISSEMKAQMRLPAKSHGSRSKRTKPLTPPQGHRQSLESRKER